ncbi:MAG: DUF262 domain-containing protein [Deltaproteobacteria bacterium]|nr:DUF262 domain-containing protein [Deltaproteobacteria bacterium]MBW2020631.1 DUF262 domain-containing protein [Deltaproteobacteria bacterium]
MADIEQSRKEFIDQTDVIHAVDGTGVETEDTESEERITEPFDPTLIRVETKPMSMDLLIARIRERELDLMPGFQRKAGIWSDAAQSRLIESMLIRIPLPAFYMDATDEDKWLIVDGLQRLTTIKRFVIEKELKLTGLEFLDQVEGKTFDELPRAFQRRINETQVTVYLIERDTPPEVKFNIFKRINTGGLPLSPQEIRHALNQGKATELLSALANSSEFKKATDYGIQDKRMADQECVLRFMAFTISSYLDYKTKDFDNFLNRTMATINKMPEQKIEQLRKQFLRSMVAAYDLFGRYAFRKQYHRNTWRYPINKALFETWSVNLNHLDDRQLEELQIRKDTLIEKFIQLMNNRDFESAISQGTGNIAKVRLRFSAIEHLLQEVLS